jgi:hypothetical protein
MRRPNFGSLIPPGLFPTRIAVLHGQYLPTLISPYLQTVAKPPSSFCYETATLAEL